METLIINSEEQLQKYLDKYNCKTKEELDDLFWYNYGVTLTINIKPHYL